MCAHLAQGYKGDVERINVVMTVLFAGIQYLILRTRNTTMFGGIAIQEDEGWAKVKESMAWLCQSLVKNDG